MYPLNLRCLMCYILFKTDSMLHINNIEIEYTLKLVVRSCSLHFCTDVHLLFGQTQDVSIFAEINCRMNFIVSPFIIRTQFLSFTYSGAYIVVVLVLYVIVLSNAKFNTIVQNSLQHGSVAFVVTVPQGFNLRVVFNEFSAL